VNFGVVEIPQLEIAEKEAWKRGHWEVAQFLVSKWK